MNYQEIAGKMQDLGYETHLILTGWETTKTLLNEALKNHQVEKSEKSIQDIRNQIELARADYLVGVVISREMLSFNKIHPNILKELDDTGPKPEKTDERTFTKPTDAYRMNCRQIFGIIEEIEDTIVETGKKINLETEEFLKLNEKNLLAGQEEIDRRLAENEDCDEDENEET